MATKRAKRGRSASGIIRSRRELTEIDGAAEHLGARILEQVGQPRQRLRDGQVAAHHQRAQVADQAEALEEGEVVAAEQRGEVLGGVRGVVVAGGGVVGHEPLGAALGLGQRQRRLAIGEQGAGAALGLAQAPAHAHRDLPGLGRAALGSGGQVALLRERDGGLAPVAAELGAHQRHAGLVEEGGERPRHVAARLGADRREEVGGGGAAVGAIEEVALHAGAEARRARRSASNIPMTAAPLE